MSESHEHVGVGMICGHVLRGERPINYVRRCPDDTWDFMCGEADHGSIDDAAVICPICAFAKVTGALTSDDLAISSYAERTSKDARWVIQPMTSEDIAEYEDEEE